MTTEDSIVTSGLLVFNWQCCHANRKLIVSSYLSNDKRLKNQILLKDEFYLIFAVISLHSGIRCVKLFLAAFLLKVRGGRQLMQLKKETRNRLGWYLAARLIQFSSYTELKSLPCTSTYSGKLIVL